MPALYRYNLTMNSDIAKQLIQLNHKFYNQFGNEFSVTRGRLQNGVMKILETIQEDESVLDLGCGNGLFLHTVSKRGHKAPLLGVDFSLPLLRDAESSGGVEFREIQLNQLSEFSNQLSVHNWSLITCFATLHHIPSNEIRLDILRTVKKLLNKNGRFILSNWQFLNSEKLKSRIQDWSKVGLSKDVVDENDYLLDWRSGGEGLRYAHHFSSEELHTLANQVDMRVEAEFLSDGENGKLGLYQVWVHG
jgi:2-polyprenyl-3-methyl-5-hydroxy-6-metoxy-1,4-benzoquinol methylase